MASPRAGTASSQSQGLIAMCLSRPKVSLSGFSLRAASESFLLFLQYTNPSSIDSLHLQALACFARGDGVFTFRKQPRGVLLYKWMERKNQVMRSPGLSLPVPERFLFPDNYNQSSREFEGARICFSFREINSRGCPL